MRSASWLMRAAAVAAMLAALLAGASGAARAPESLDATLAPFLARYDLPALAAAVVKDGEIVAAGAVGTRKAGANLPVTLDDRFHLGSNTKAMTALLAGMLVDEGKLRWESTVADLFPELVEKMDPGLKRVTLEQLLSHTSGVPADNEAIENLIDRAQLQEGNLDEMRYWLVREWRGQPLAAPPGTRWAYSNMNYVIAGAMIERLSGKTWDELITERVFTPLGLRSGGLGPQATLGRIDAPLGHDVVDGKMKAFLAGPKGDNPLVVGPAGSAHMSVLDFARWAGWQAGEGKRGPALVRPETMKKLHAMVGPWPFPPGTEPGWPSRGRYGLGMGEVVVDWAPEPLLHHLGQNRKNLASIWIEPKRDFAMVLVTNSDTKKSNDALYALSADLYRRFGGVKSGAGPSRRSSAQEPLARARLGPTAARSAPSLRLAAGPGTPSPEEGDFAGRVGIGGGRHLFLECAGSGRPVVVFEAGLRNRGDIWSVQADDGKRRPMVFPGVAAFTRVCAYDRPGTTLGADPFSRSW